MQINMLRPEQLGRISKFLNHYTDETVESYRQIYQEQKEQIKKEEYYRAYLRIVKRTANILRELGVNNPLTACIAFEYLLWNGFLSIDRKLVYSISNRINNTVITGADIMRGKSVCLNNAEMLSRILRELKYDGYMIGCNLNPRKDQKIGYKPEIKRLKEKEKLKDSLISNLLGATIMKKVGNHAVVVSKYNGLYFIADPTSLAFANTSDILKAQYVDSDIEIELKPYLMLMLGDIKPDKFKQITAGMILQGQSQLLDVPTVKGISHATVEQCRDNRILLNHFYDENYEDTDIVCKTLQKQKRK